MEAAASKPTSNISNLVSRFAQVCKFRSIGAHASHQIKLGSHPAAEDDGTDGADAIEEEKKSNNPPAVKIVSNKGNDESVAAASDVLKVFEIVSAFKVAYVQLQQAHIPYNPQKTEAADELAVRQLEALCKVKQRLCKANLQFGKTSHSSSWSAYSHLLPPDKIHIRGRALERLKLEAKTKNCDLLCLRRQLLKLELENADLIEQLDTVTTEVEQKTSDCAQCPDLSELNDVVKAAYKSIHDFAKPLIGLLKASGWNLDLAAKSVVQDWVVFSKRCHKKYAFEAYIARRMFSRLGSIHQHSIDGIRCEDDPINYLIKDPCSAFAQFCRSKYLLVVHSDMELSFFGNLDHRTLVSRGKHPRTAFYQAFAKMARLFWVLLGVAGSITPKAVMYEVKIGTEFSDSYMDLVDEDVKAIDRSYRSQPSDKVSFMVMPGFEVGNKVIKSLVYCHQTKC